MVYYYIVYILHALEVTIVEYGMCRQHVPRGIGIN